MKVAIDPGKHVGVAYAAGPLMQSLETTETTIWNILMELHGDLNDIETIIMERFNRVRGNIDVSAIEVIGVVKQWARMYSVPVVLQSKSQAGHFFTDARLKDEGYYRPNNRHANDAMRHLLYYMNFGEGKKNG